MPKAYCHCCQKDTHHKVVMKRCQSENESVLQSIFAMFTHGAHYVKMEKQGYCRVCNSENQIATMDLQNARVI